MGKTTYENNIFWEKQLIITHNLKLNLVSSGDFSLLVI